MGRVINGVSLRLFYNGWWGEHGEGNKLLGSLGLPQDKFPTSVEKLLKNSVVSFTDAEKNCIFVCFSKNDEYFEFYSIRQGKKRIARLHREWQSESLDAIIRLESYAIGECIRHVLAGESII